MSAALIELVSVGAQDVYITGDPQVSFFRQNYKRYTNFAMKAERMDYIGTFDSSNEVSIPIRSKGDLMSYIWIEADGIAEVQQNTSGLYSNNAASPTEFALWIGGQKVSQLDSLYIQGVHNPLMRDTSAKASFAVSTNARKDNHTGNHYMIPSFSVKTGPRYFLSWPSSTTTSKFVSSAVMVSLLVAPPRYMITTST